MDAAKFKQALSRYASGVTVITTRAPAGGPVGFTATAFCSLSLEPPMVLFCLHRESSRFGAFRRAEGFAVNVLAGEQAALATAFARGGVEGHFPAVAHRAGRYGAPVLEGCLATLECRLSETYPGGDHVIFVGAVEAAEAREGEPLVHGLGGFYRLGADAGRG